MADREYKHFKGEGGKVWRMELPLAPDIAKQVDKGLLVEVEPEKPKRPARKAAPEKAAEPLTDDEKKTASERGIEVEGKDPADVRGELAKPPASDGK
jgi:hypothetical protein